MGLSTYDIKTFLEFISGKKIDIVKKVKLPTMGLETHKKENTKLY